MTTDEMMQVLLEGASFNELMRSAKSIVNGNGVKDKEESVFKLHNNTDYDYDTADIDYDYEHRPIMIKARYVFNDFCQNNYYCNLSNYEWYISRDIFNKLMSESFNGFVSINSIKLFGLPIRKVENMFNLLEIRRKQED